MSNDPLVKAVTGLMTAHHTTTRAVSTLHVATTTLQATVATLEAAMVTESGKIQEILEVVTAMANNSVETQKRLRKLEVAVDALQNKAS